MESDIGRTPCSGCLQDQPCHAGKVKRQFPLPAARLFAWSFPRSAWECSRGRSASQSV